MRRKTVWTLLAAGVLLAVSFVMPGAVLTLRSRALAARDQEVAAEEVHLSLLTPLDTPEALKVAGSTASTAIPLSSGRIHTEENVRAAADRLVYEEIGGYDVSNGAFTVTTKVDLRVGEDGSALILWTVNYVSTRVDITVVMDDRNLACLGLTYGEYLNNEEASAPDNGSKAEAGEVTGLLDPDPAEFPTYEEFYGVLELANRVICPAYDCFDSFVYQGSHSTMNIILADGSVYAMPLTLSAAFDQWGQVRYIGVSIN